MESISESDVSDDEEVVSGDPHSYQERPGGEASDGDDDTGLPAGEGGQIQKSARSTMTDVPEASTRPPTIPGDPWTTRTHRAVGGESKRALDRAKRWTHWDITTVALRANVISDASDISP